MTGGIAIPDQGTSGSPQIMLKRKLWTEDVDTAVPEDTPPWVAELRVLFPREINTAPMPI